MLLKKARWVSYILLLMFGAVLSALGEAPPNDHFTNAIVLVGDSVTFAGTLSNATTEPDEVTDPCNPGLNSVWWSWTATNSSAVVLENVDHSFAFYGGFSVLTGANVDSLSPLDCSPMDFITNRYVSFSATSGATYYFRVSGEADSFVFRLAATNAPLILVQPQSQTVAASSSGWFGVIAAGMAPLSYQWQFEGNDLAGQTAPSLILHHLGANQSGGYSVVVSNFTGMTTSAVANLAISPADPRPALAALSLSDTNRFNFELAGVAGRRYLIEGSTNLIDWAGEEEFWSCCEGNPGMVQLTNQSAQLSISRVSDQKFLRASPFLRPEICITQLKQIQFTLKCAAIQMRFSSAHSISHLEIVPYLADLPVCPSGGTTFDDSYSISDLGSLPTCQKMPGAHFLPP